MDKPQLHVESKILYRIHYDPTSCYYSEPAYPLRIFILQFFNNYSNINFLFNVNFSKWYLSEHRTIFCTHFLSVPFLLPNPLDPYIVRINSQKDNLWEISTLIDWELNLLEKNVPTCFFHMLCSPDIVWTVWQICIKLIVNPVTF